MSALLKPGAGDMVRSLGSPAASVESAPDPRELECTQLRAQLAALRARVIEMEGASTEAANAAREQGLRQGLAEAEASEEQKLSALRSGIDTAVTAWKSRLELWEGLAALLAGTALARMFEPHADMQEQATRMLARQLREIRRTGVVAIHVSCSDFAGSDALNALRERLGCEMPVALEIDPDLESGACRITCAMEQIDLDVREQWSALAQVLREMASEGAAP